MPSIKKSASRAATPAPTLPPAQVFRTAIETAQAQGADVSAMLLHLTLSDQAKLKRDRTIPLEDIRFADGEMRFLGVRIVTGGGASVLEVSPS